jgi:hypothetical protein
VTSANNRLIYLERVKGIEPSSKAWELDHGPFPNNALAPNLLKERVFELLLSPADYRSLPRLVSQIVPRFWFLARADLEGDRD